MLILWLIVYLSAIVKAFMKILSTKKLLEALSKFIHSVSIEKTDFGCNETFRKKSDFEANKCAVLSLVPAINRALDSWFGCGMDYENTDEKNYRAAVTTYNKLLMTQNYKIDEFKQSLNPFYGLKTLFRLPSILLKWLGINFKGAGNKLLNIISWIIVYLLYAYQAEIKTLLSWLFH